MDIFENFVDVSNKSNDDKLVEATNPDECFTHDENLDGMSNYSCIQCGKIFNIEKKYCENICGKNGLVMYCHTLILQWNRPF